MKHSSQTLELSPIEIINIESNAISPLISKCVIKVCYVGDEPNRNRSIITKETAIKMAPSLRGAAIVGFYNEDKGDFEEHNRVIDISNGQFKIKDTTRPYGFVDLGARVWFQKFLDDGQFEREYLMTEGYLWTGQYPEAQRVIEQGNNQSMELDNKLIDAHWTKDNKGNPQFFIINEAIISKLCILGEDVEPCFEGASISRLEFSFEESFKEQLFTMMNEMKQILNEGGAPKMTTYAVEIGSKLWDNIYDFANANNYEITAIMEEENQTFAVLQNREDEAYARLNFSYNEEEGTFVYGWAEGEFVYELPEEPQFAAAAIADYKAGRAEEDNKDDDEEEKCPECGKPKSECVCEDDDEDEEFGCKKKKRKYTLEEIPEYVELQNKYSELESKYNELVSAKEAQDASMAELMEFKKAAERKEKQEMINNQFYMLSDELKKDVVDNIDTYSLSDIEAKLSIICVRNKINFNLDDDNNPGTDPITYNLNGSSMEDDATPAWIKAVMATAKTLN